MRSNTDFQRNRLALVMLAGLGLFLALMFLAPGSLPAAPVAAQSLNAAVGGTPLAPAANHLVAHPEAAGDVDPTFNAPCHIFNDCMYSVALQVDGKILVGGMKPQSKGIARLNSDGTQDATFQPPFVASPKDIVLQPDGKVLVGGSASVVRLNSDGTQDATFVAGALNSLLLTTVLQPNGKVLIGGQFTQVGSQARHLVARLNSNGTLDTGFATFANALQDVGGSVEALALQPGGKVLVGGIFYITGGGRSDARATERRWHAGCRL